MTTSTEAVRVLNMSYEDLGSTRLARAIALILKGEAEVVEPDPHRQIHHKSGEMQMPLIIRMLRYIKVPFRYGPKVWSKAGVLERDGYKCAYCPKKGRNIVTTVDHVLPQAAGGRDTWDNTVACCTKCNGLKGNLLLDVNNQVFIKVGHKTITLTLQHEPVTPMKVFISSKNK